jgi:hypothetical protein
VPSQTSDERLITFSQGAIAAGPGRIAGNESNAERSRTWLSRLTLEDSHPTLPSPSVTLFTGRANMPTAEEARTILLQRRYRDAYSVAEATVGWGTLLKVLGLIAGLVIAVLGLVAAPNLGIGGVAASIVIAVAIAGTMYALGIAVAAQGQIIRAILDTAVNTSPLLTDEQKQAVILSSGEQASAAAPVAGDWLNCRNCGKLIRLDANTTKCYLCNQAARTE